MYKDAAIRTHCPEPYSTSFARVEGYCVCVVSKHHKSALLNTRSHSQNKLVLYCFRCDHWLTSAGGFAVHQCEVCGHAQPTVQPAAPVSLLVSNQHRCQWCGTRASQWQVFVAQLQLFESPSGGLLPARTLVRMWSALLFHFSPSSPLPMMSTRTLHQQ